MLLRRLDRIGEHAGDHLLAAVAASSKLLRRVPRWQE
jgi:hypothetical protein